MMEEIEIELDDELVEWLEKYAKETNQTLDEVINQALRDYLDELEKS